MADQGQAKKVIAAVVILGIAGAILLSRGNSGSKSSNQSWYYDLESGRLFAAEAGQIPPVDAPSGLGRGVLAYVVSCGACDEAGRQIAYLQTMTERGQALMADPDLPRQPGEELDAQQIALPPAAGEPVAWVSAGSQQAAAIQNRISSLCQGGPAKTCNP